MMVPFERTDIVVSGDAAAKRLESKERMFHARQPTIAELP